MHHSQEGIWRHSTKLKGKSEKAEMRENKEQMILRLSK